MKKIIFTAVILCLTIPTIKGQTISYLLPDIGTPDMNTYVEIIGPYNQNGNFGTDGIYTNNIGDAVRVVCANPSDTNKIQIGPVIVSWNGKMVSTQVFVLPGQNPNSGYWDSLSIGFRIPLQVVTNGTQISNADTFYIVKSSPAIITSQIGILGSGGMWGTRSRRGAMIVDDIQLTGTGVYGVSVNDADAATPGNQGYLPAVIISKTGITMGAGAILSVDSIGKSAGPGGGGGGAASSDGFGGNGFCSGGYSCSGSSGQGSGVIGGTVGTSLNALPPGGNSCDQGGGGGTGHPFGLSGLAGAELSNSTAGQYGAGTAGGETTSGNEFGGGGAGNASVGMQGVGTGSDAGQITGNSMIVPLSGGSGGGAGNVWNNQHGGSGGGGGGGISLYGMLGTNLYTIKSNGGNGSSGQSDQTAGGGGGSGGNILVSTKLTHSVNISANVLGGIHGNAGGSNSNDGGDGSVGRIRIDGSYNSTTLTPGATQYQGPSTDTTGYLTCSTFVLTGTGNGSNIRIYVKPQYGAWSLNATVTGYNNNKWSQYLSLTGAIGSLWFIAAAQDVTSPNAGQYTAEPSWVFSQSAANIERVIVDSLPAHTVSANVTIIQGNSTTLSVNRKGVTILWSPSVSLSCKNCLSATADPTLSTLYYVTMTGTDGCKSKDSVLVTVKEKCGGEVFVPDAFSPNGDGQNDVLYLMTQTIGCIQNMSFQIFDRWGEKVFESIDPASIGWDGKYMGKEMDKAVFVYNLQAILADGTAINKRGNISLIK